MDHEPTPAQMAAAIVEKTATNRVLAVQKQVSYRLPISTLAQVEALALQAGVSRNSFLNTLIEVGIAGVVESLSDKTLKAMRKREHECLTALLEGVNESGEL